jgi:heat-inducible transcriptional repressor
MQELTDRQKKVLLLIVRDYIDTAQPVGSQRLVEQYNLEMSSATIRNEMVALTEMGFLRQPHTSAGRVPSEDGYRYFVTQMMNQVELPEAVQHTISHQFYQARPEIEQWMVLAASVLSQQSQAISLVTAPHAEKMYFKHVELISTQGRQVLMVLVTMGGEVSQQILSLAEPVSQEKLSAAAVRLNQVFAGRSLGEINSLPSRTDSLENDIALLIMQDMRRIGERITGQLYLDGLSNVLSEPEFNASNEARRALRLLEERSLLHDLLAGTILHHGAGGMQVLIGGEGDWEELRQCSVILARYGAPGAITGTLGVLGPMRMSYARTIPTVRYVAGVLSDLVTDAFVDENSE